jgi:hypothetical protein
MIAVERHEENRMTKSLRIESRVGTDGVFTLCVPLGPSDANTNVIVTIQPKNEAQKPGKGANWPEGYFDQTYGCLADDPLTIPDDPIPASGEMR